MAEALVGRTDDDVDGVRAKEMERDQYLHPTDNTWLLYHIHKQPNTILS